MSQSSSPRPTVTPPSVFASNEPGAFLEALRSPWYALVGDLHDVFVTTTMEYACSRGLKNLHLPLTTRTITCPTALGSDAEPVPVKLLGVDTYLPDSMQFLLEYGCRISPGGCYTIMPSFRAEEPDETHLNQFTHSEAEIPGGLDELIDYVNGYVKALASAILAQQGDRLAAARGDVSHLERMAGYPEAFEQITFDEAIRLVGDVEDCVRDEGEWRTLTRKGERLLMERVSEFLWVHHFDTLAVPFYQAFGDEEERTVRAADLYFGLGEIVGSGERQTDVGLLRKSIALHGVNEQEYEWYVRMRGEMPMRTAGFGMGVERFLMWVLNHHDIRDIPLVSRLNEPKAWPEAVLRP